MPNYNLSSLNNTVVSVTTWLVTANELSNNWFGALVTLAWFVIIFVSLKKFGNPQAFAASSATTLVFALYGRTALFISDQVLFITIALVAGVAVFIYIRK